VKHQVDDLSIRGKEVRTCHVLSVSCEEGERGGLPKSGEEACHKRMRKEDESPAEKWGRSCQKNFPRGEARITKLPNTVG